MPVPPMAPPESVITPVRIMTAKAQGTYQQYIDLGWNDTKLMQHGLMQP